MHLPMETRRRSIAKAISWRFFATLITAAVVYAMTRRVEFAATVGVVDTLIKLFVYFVHERFWLRIPYGRPKRPEFEI